MEVSAAEISDPGLGMVLNRAFRAPGYPQCAWALEQTMDALAEKIGEYLKS